MSINRGKKFEQCIEKGFSKVPDVSVTRLHDQTTGYLGSTNICDFLIFHKPYLYAIECKSVHGNTLSIYSKPKKDKNGRLHGFYGNITDKQWEGLLEISHITGVRAGIIVWFVDKNTTYFLDIGLLQRWRNAGNKSIHYYPEWVQYVQTNIDWVQIQGRKKRVFYEYDMAKFIKEMEYE